MRYFLFGTILLSALLISGCGSSDEESDVSTTTDTTTNTTTPLPATSATDTNQNKIAVPAANTVTAPALNNQPVATNSVGLNPEHGKPGHRCDIAVGAPLDSKPTQPAASPSISLPANSQKSAPVISSPTITPTVTPATTAPVTGAGLNPEHGKPGHRCDIAVGAPLNSAPAAKTTQPAQTITPSISPAPAVQPSATPVTPVVSADAGALNPEHGKPGHRCDIAVGAPLNSKPKQ